MNRITHAIYIAVMTIITLVVTVYIGVKGYAYYTLPEEERFYHPDYDWFKPSGLFGQGIGIIGTLMILIGVVLYILAKKYGFLTRFVRLKYLLEFHIFLCTLGPILILYHTTFKFGGIVSVAFWSMVAVVASGVVGRFIYIQIPHTIEGREMSLAEVQDSRKELIDKIKSYSPEGLPIEKLLFSTGADNAKPKLGELRKVTRQHIKDRKNRKEVIGMIKQEVSLSRKIRRLAQMQKLFKYWHVAHRPFALIMLIIVVVHVVVTLGLGYTWIF